MNDVLISGGRIVTAVDDLEAVVEACDSLWDSFAAIAPCYANASRGLPAFAETCPHYLFLNSDEYERPGFEAAKYVMIPPLRDHQCQQALRRGLKFDDLQIIATDHCPFCFNENIYGLHRSKQLGRNNFEKIINGAPGVELRLPLLFDGGVKSGKISLNRFVQLISTAPAKMFGLFPRKGAIALGSDADLVLVDPDKQHRISAVHHHSNVDYSLYEGRPVTGKVEKVFFGGELIVDGDSWFGRKGRGKYQKRSASGVF